MTPPEVAQAINANTDGYSKAMNLELVSVSAELVEARWTVGSQHLQPYGIVHGGVLPAIADGAMGNALRTLYGKTAQVLTAEIHLHYLRPVNHGALIAEGNVVRSGRRLSFGEVEIRSETTGKAVAKGTGIFVIEPKAQVPAS